MQKGFGLVGVLLITIVFLIIGGGGYFFYQNNQQINEQNNNIKPKPEVEIKPTNTPTPVLETSITDIESENPLNIKITGDKIYKVLANGKTQILEEFNDSEYGGTINDLQTNFSPDKKRISLTGQGGISPRILYWSLVSTPKLIRIGSYEEFEWSPDSRYLAYSARGGDCGPVTRINIYDTKNNQDLNIDKYLTPPIFKYEDRGFGSIKWESNSQSVNVDYTVYDGEGCGGGGNDLKQGTLNIPIN